MTTNQEQVSTAVSDLDKIISLNLKPRLQKLLASKSAETNPAIKYQIGEAAARLARAIKDIQRCTKHAEAATKL